MDRRTILKILAGITILLGTTCTYGIIEIMYADGKTELDKKTKELLKKGHKLVNVIRKNDTIYEIQYRERRSE